MSKILTSIPKQAYGRTLDSIALMDIVENKLYLDHSVDGYFVSPRGGYVYFSRKAGEAISAFVEKIQAAAKEKKVELPDPLPRSHFMLWRHSNEKAPNQELYFNYPGVGEVNHSIPVSCLIENRSK